MKQFNVSTDTEQGIAIVRLSGELDASTATKADTALIEALAGTTKALLVDCADLTYISSAGLGAILSTFHACKQRSVRLVMFSLQPKIQNVLTILGLEKIITIVKTEEDALKLVH